MADMNLLSIDPGTDQGWAWWPAGVLTACGLGREPAGLPLTHLRIECPWYRKDSPSDPQDMITLAVKVGRVLERYDHPGVDCATYYPHQWKRNANKKQVEAVVWPALSVAERAVLRAALAGVAKGKQHNVIEAVGIGLKALGRYR